MTSDNIQCFEGLFKGQHKKIKERNLEDESVLSFLISTV